MRRGVVIAIFAGLGLIALASSFLYQPRVDALRAERDAVLDQGVIADQPAWQAKNDEFVAADRTNRLIWGFGVCSLGAVVAVALSLDRVGAELELRNLRRAANQ